MDSFKQISRDNKKRAKEINLKELFLVIKRRFWVIVVVTVFLSLVGYILNQSPIVLLYQSSSRIIIYDNEEARNTLQVIVRDSSVLDQVIKKLDLIETSDQLANQISVASVDNSQVVSISVIYTNPVIASKIANMTAEVFKEEVPKFSDQTHIKILSKAKINPIPINQKTNKKIIFGFIGGIVGGIGIAFFLESLDDRIRSKKEIEDLLDVPVLGRIPKMNKRNLKKQENKIQLDDVVRGEGIGK
jgi:capsular polysaccharide biosynthesis protein